MLLVQVEKVARDLVDRNDRIGACGIGDGGVRLCCIRRGMVILERREVRAKRSIPKAPALVACSLAFAGD